MELKKKLFWKNNLIHWIACSSTENFHLLLLLLYQSKTIIAQVLDLKFSDLADVRKLCCKFLGGLNYHRLLLLWRPSILQFQLRVRADYTWQTPGFYLYPPVLWNIWKQKSVSKLRLWSINILRTKVVLRKWFYFYEFSSSPRFF